MRELEARPELKEPLDKLLGSVAGDENYFYKYVCGDYEPLEQYEAYAGARNFFMNLAEGAQQIPKPHHLP